MVRAWRIRESELDKNKLETVTKDVSYLDMDTVRKTTGVLCWKLDPVTYKVDGSLEKIKRERGYVYEDELEISEETLPNFNIMVGKLATEHLHSKEELRFMLDGKGYFDVREGLTDEWIRIELVKGDLIAIPAGLYHRLILDPKRYLKGRRLFIGGPSLLTYNRNSDKMIDKMKCRRKYLENIRKINLST